MECGALDVDQIEAKDGWASPPQTAMASRSIDAGLLISLQETLRRLSRCNAPAMAPSV